MDKFTSVKEALEAFEHPWRSRQKRWSDAVRISTLWQSAVASPWVAIGSVAAVGTLLINAFR